MARIELSDIQTGLGMLGGVLSLPRQVQNQQIQNEQLKTMLQGSGISEDLIKAATPEPSMRWLSAGQPGFGGKVLGGVGDVGSLLMTIVGKPITAPRMDIADLAAASKLRSGHAEALAKDRLGQVIMDPKSTKRDIAGAAIAAGNTDQALRMMRGDEGKPPASVLGLRSAIESMEPNDPRRPAYQRALDDQLAYLDEQRRQTNEDILSRQPPHYDPAQSEAMRHKQIMEDRAKDAADRGLKPGTPEHDYFMSSGRMPQAPREKAARTLDDYIADENRQRNAMLKNPRTAKQVADMEPVEVTARRKMAAAEQAAAAKKSGAPLPEAPPKRAKRGATAGAAVGGVLGGETPTPPPAAATGDEPALAVLRNIDFDALPADIKQQVLDASAAGMPKQDLANWLLSLQPPTQP